MIPTLSLFQAHPQPRTPIDVAVQQTRALYEAGGLILFGTDAGFTDEFDTRPELLLMQQAIGWRGVFSSLTSAPARMFGEAALRGRIEAGLMADLVLIGGDPAIDITALADVRLVLRGGAIIYDSELTPPQASVELTVVAPASSATCDNPQAIPPSES